MDRRRLIVPTLFAIAGIACAVVVVDWLSGIVGHFMPGYDLIAPVRGRLASDAMYLLTVVVPVYLVELIVFTFPIALVMVLVNRVARAGRYTQSIVDIGQGFSAFRLIRRSVVPALFSLSFGELIVGLAPGWLFNEPSVHDPGLVNIIYPLLSLLAALMSLAVALPLFAPTWLLNDAGIVSHLRREELEMRQCPDFEGVGKWFNSFISGFALLTFPITMANRYFYQAFVIRGIPITAMSVFQSVFATVGLPVLVMAFVMPVVLFHELLLPRFVPAVHWLATRLGMKRIRLSMFDVTSDE